MFFALGVPLRFLKSLVKDCLGSYLNRFLPPGRFYNPLAPLWCHFVRFLGPLGSILDPSWTMLALSGAMFGPFWSHVVSSWPCLVPFGTMFGPF